MDNLKWIRIMTPHHIPKKYVDQLKGVNFTTSDFYDYQESACLIPSKEGPKLNPLNHLYVLVDEKNIVKGFMWFVVDNLGKDIVLQNLSVDQSLWNKGQIIEKVSEHLKMIKEKANLNKIYWLTRAPKHSEKYGFKRSKEVLMEYVGEEDGKLKQRSDESERNAATGLSSGESMDREHGICREHSPSKRRAAASSKSDS